MPHTMTLIAGRTAKQGVAISAGKFKGEYHTITSTAEMNADDMAMLGLTNGDKIRLRTKFGTTVLKCTARKSDDLPSGILFVPYGPSSSRLMGSDTGATGMPLSKNLDVEVEVVAKQS